MFLKTSQETYHVTKFLIYDAVARALSVNGWAGSPALAIALLVLMHVDPRTKGFQPSCQ